MNKNLKDKTLSSIKLLKISPKRSMGQIFLINDSVVDSILRVAKPEFFDKVFEVGPGLGALTDPLKEKTKNLTLLEFDKKLCHFWDQRGFEIKQVNALCFDWKENLKPGNSRLLVSNLPFQIASRLLVELSILEQSFDRMVLMFQKEVARRILAKSGTRDYGFLTVIAKSFWNIHFVLEAGTVDFFPKPRVASQVLCFDRKNQGFPKRKASAIPAPSDLTGLRGYQAALNIEATPDPDPPGLRGDPLHFTDFVKRAFMSRRKKLLPKLTGYAEKAKWLEIFEKMNLNERVRAEELTPEQFMELALQCRILEFHTKYTH